jgi:hypothetical protein
MWIHRVEFKVASEVTMKMAVFWVVAPCSLVEVHEVSEVLAASIIRAMSAAPVSAPIKEAASTSGTSVNFYQTTRCYSPEDSHIKFTQIILLFPGCYSFPIDFVLQVLLVVVPRCDCSFLCGLDFTFL